MPLAVREAPAALSNAPADVYVAVLYDGPLLALYFHHSSGVCGCGGRLVRRGRGIGAGNADGRCGHPTARCALNVGVVTWYCIDRSIQRKEESMLNMLYHTVLYNSYLVLR